MNFTVTTLALVIPVSLTIYLWRRDQRRSVEQEQERAAQEFTSRLAGADENAMTLIRLGHIGNLLVAYPGALAMASLIDAYIEHADLPATVDLPIDVAMLLRTWRGNKEYRVDSTEIFYARSSVALACEDNPPLSAQEIETAERMILEDDRCHKWLRRSRLAPWRIRLRRVSRWLMRKIGMRVTWRHDNSLTEGAPMRHSAKLRQETPYPL